MQGRERATFFLSWELLKHVFDVNGNDLAKRGDFSRIGIQDPGEETEQMNAEVSTVEHMSGGYGCVLWK